MNIVNHEWKVYAFERVEQDIQHHGGSAFLIQFNNNRSIVPVVVVSIMIQGIVSLSLSLEGFLQVISVQDSNAVFVSKINAA